MRIAPLIRLVAALLALGAVCRLRAQDFDISSLPPYLPLTAAVVREQLKKLE